MKPRFILARSVLAAIVLGTAFPFYGVALGWLLPTSPLVGFYWVGAAATYVAVIAPNVPRAFGAFVLASLLGGSALLLTGSQPLLAGALALVIAVVRSGYFQRPNRARALVIEGAILVVSLAFAAFLSHGGTMLGVSLAIWGFFLVQSFHVVIADVQASPEDSANLDGFEHAAARAAALMDEG